jgi:predicted RNase H-like HicB family nuclease
LTFPLFKTIESSRLISHYVGEITMKFLVVLEPAEEGGYNVSVPALDGCFTQGDTEEDALSNAKEAIACYLEGLEKVNQIKAQPGVKALEVEVAL